MVHRHVLYLVQARILDVMDWPLHGMKSLHAKDGLTNQCDNLIIFNVWCRKKEHSCPPLQHILNLTFAHANMVHRLIWALILWKERFKWYRNRTAPWEGYREREKRADKWKERFLTHGKISNFHEIYHVLPFQRQDRRWPTMTHMTIKNRYLKSGYSERKLFDNGKSFHTFKPCANKENVSK